MTGQTELNPTPAPQPPKPQPLLLKFKPEPGDAGEYVPYPTMSKDEQIEALASSSGLYGRCLEAKAKMETKLAEKYLQPLSNAKKLSGAEAIEEHKKKLQRLFEGLGAADR